MRGSWSNLLFLILIALGAIGLVSLIWLHPLVLVKQIIIGGLIIGVIYALYRYFTRKTATSETNAYRRAVKQSKRRKKAMARHRTPSKLQAIPTPSLKKKRPSLERLKHKGHGHLTVIEGKKKKRKKGFL